MNIINLSVPAGVSSPVAECGAVMIGYVGESGVTQVVLDFSAWAEVYGDGVITLGVQRSRDASWYPVALSVDGTTAAWLVSRTDTNVEGMGVARFAYAVGGAEKRSAVWQFFVDRGLQSPEGDAPDPYESWVETLTELGEETLENAQDAQEAAEDAEQSATDAAGSAESAETAKNAAGAAAAAAGESARAAEENASTAQGAAQVAQNAAGEAEQSATDAEAAQQAAETAVTHYPKIVNDYWWVWDVTTGAYVNTNVKAKGEDGEGAVLSVNGKTGAVTLDAEDVGALPEGTTLDDIPDGSTYKRATAAQVQQISTNAADIQTQGGEIDQLQTDVDAIEQKIPNQASSSNQLADKDFVNSSINSAAAYFRGAFPTRAALFAVPWQTADPGAENYVSNNDYAYVADDEAHNDEAWRYIYVLQPGGADNGWQPQFRVNESPLTAAQLAALNSGATAALIEQISTNAAAIALKQAVINASGLLKGNGNGQVSAAVAGTDYQTPLTAGTDYATPAQVNAKYTKPAGGIPASDMAQAVQTSLGKADTALQAVPNTYRTAAAQDVIDAGKLPATTKYAGSQSVGGPADKTVSIPMGSVDLTSTETDFKATVDGITELRSGVLVWLTNGVVTSAAGCTLNINNLGAKPIYNSIAATTATTTTFNVNYTMLFIYNATRVTGGCWDMVYGYDSNTTYTPAKLGFGYATCSTAAATTAKVASLSSYSLVAGGLVAVNFSNNVPANATLNINSKGAKAIYYEGTAIEAGVINAGDTALFVYSTYYRLLSIDRWGEDISSILSTVAAKYTKPSGGIPASDMAQAVQTSLGKADTALQAVPNTYRTAADQDVIDSGLSSQISAMQPAATAADVGKALIVKTVDTQTGKPASYEYGEAGGGGASIDLGITDAAVGDTAVVNTIDENGSPTSWRTEKVMLTLTIICQTELGGPVSGPTVTVRQGGPKGEIFASQVYNGQPMCVLLPVGFYYYISATEDLSGFGPANTVHGIMTDHDVMVTLTYRTNKRYGFRRAKNNSDPYGRITYLYDAVDKVPAGMSFGADGVGTFTYGSWENFVNEVARPVMLKSDGTVDYELDHNDQTLKMDGTPSDISDLTYDGNAMVEVSDAFAWVKRYEDEDYEYVIFCDQQYDQDYHAYAHTNDSGVVKSAFYIGMFTGPYNSNILRSMANGSPPVNQNAEVEITRAGNNGSGYNILYKSAWDYIADILTLISKTDNSQLAFGSGIDSRKSQIQTPGALKDKGPFWGTNNGLYCVKTLWIENFWGNMWQRVAGYINDNGTIKVKMTGPYCNTPVSNANYSTYTVTNITPTGSSGGYAKNSHCGDYGTIPYGYSGSSSTYLCDGGWFNNSIVAFAGVGADYGGGAGVAGSRAVSVLGAASGVFAYFGSRLSYIPV